MDNVTIIVEDFTQDVTVEVVEGAIKGDKGDQGIQGEQGVQGIQGDAGEGIITGGTTGQVLAKASDTDYDTEWVDVSGGLTSSQEYSLRVTFSAGEVENILNVQTELDAVTNEKLLLIPSGYGYGKIYSQIPTNGTGDGTFSRASTATRVNKDGIIEAVDINVPRIDYSSGEAAILIELQSTNLLLGSDDFTNVKWGTIAASITQNQGISPDGLYNLTKLECTSSNGRISQNLILPTSNVTYCFSVFIKKGSVDYVNLITGGFDTTSNSYFDVLNGVVISSFNSTATIEDIGNGIYRCSITFTSISDLAGNVNIYPSSDGASNGTTGNNIYIWGAQLEQQSYPTSYIPTTSTTVTRSADSCSILVPSGVTQIIETIDGVEQAPITTIPTTYNLPLGNINKIKMI